MFHTGLGKRKGTGLLAALVAIATAHFSPWTTMTGEKKTIRSRSTAKRKQD